MTHINQTVLAHFALTFLIYYLFFSPEPWAGGQVPLCHSWPGSQPGLRSHVGAAGAVLYQPEGTQHH